MRFDIYWAPEGRRVATVDPFENTSARSTPKKLSAIPHAQSVPVVRAIRNADVQLYAAILARRLRSYQ